MNIISELRAINSFPKKFPGFYTTYLGSPDTYYYIYSVFGTGILIPGYLLLHRSVHKVSISMEESQLQDGFINSIGDSNILPKWAQGPRRYATQTGSPWPQHWHPQETMRMANPQACHRPQAPTPSCSVQPHIHTPYTIRMPTTCREVPLSQSIRKTVEK